MLKVSPDQRPTAEQCIQHSWFSKDREALQNMLALNKHNEEIAEIFNLPVILEGDAHLHSCESFVVAPNYFELVECLSLKKSDNRSALGSNNVPGSPNKLDYNRPNPEEAKRSRDSHVLDALI
jgi:serine/threonine protein kinase